MLLRIQSERIHVDAHRRNVGVMLVRLDQIEVAAFALTEPILTVELDVCHGHGIASREPLHGRNRITRFQGRAIPVIRVIERLLALPRVH